MCCADAVCIKQETLNVHERIEIPGKASGGIIGFVRLQGLNTLRSGVTQLYRNQIPIYEMMSGAALAFAALLLIIPGFATDIIGFLLILPITRSLIFKYLGKKYKKEKVKDDLIEGEYEDKDK